MEALYELKSFGVNLENIKRIEYKELSMKETMELLIESLKKKFNQ